MSAFTWHTLKIITRTIIKNHLFQVKPLLQVTNTEEKLLKKDIELKVIVENLEKLTTEHHDLEQTYRDVVEEKTLLSKKLASEQEISAELEEVSHC